MLKEYDIEKLNPRPNIYAKEAKNQTMISINSNVAEYFKEEATKLGIPYQILINLYLTDCVNKNRKLEIEWK